MLKNRLRNTSRFWVCIHKFDHQRKRNPKSIAYFKASFQNHLCINIWNHFHCVLCGANGWTASFNGDRFHSSNRIVYDAINEREKKHLHTPCSEWERFSHQCIASTAKLMGDLFRIDCDSIWRVDAHTHAYTRDVASHSARSTITASTITFIINVYLRQLRSKRSKKTKLSGDRIAALYIWGADDVCFFLLLSLVSSSRTIFTPISLFHIHLWMAQSG